MRLKHLTLQGYKSFATKTEFLFPTGITAIVGPNGSGKSNVADGIRWALGEQRMTMLRGKSTVDMIFAGGRHRARAGMAEVSLTLDNADGWLPIEFSEVTIARRADRSGENEYLINGARVRLRDITTLLAESGLSDRAYTVIGQGLVDAALSLRPQERRTLFEEAAGISVYRDRREDAVQRLEETLRNLERVRDIVGEITPRLRRLERESKQVEEHRRVSVHLERLQRTWYGHRWGRHQSALDRALQVAAALDANLQKQQGNASALEERLDRLHQQEGGLRAELRDWHRESAELHDQANEVQRELAVAEERVRLLQVRREELLAELEPLGEQQEAQAEKIAQSRVQVERLARELEERKGQLAALEQEWSLVQERAQELEQRRVQAERELRARREQLEQLNQELLDARSEAARMASEQAVAEERARQLESRYGEILAEIESLGGQREAQEDKVAQARAEMARLERDLAQREEQLVRLEQEWAGMEEHAKERDQQRASLEQELRACRARSEKLGQSLAEARAEVARLSGEEEALSRVGAGGDVYDVGVKALLQAGLPGVLGPLASFVRVPQRWERAIEAALGPDLQAVVMEEVLDVEAVRRILEPAGGRVTLLPIDVLRVPPALPEGVLRASDVVTYGDGSDERVRTAAEAVLGTVALCDTWSAARALLPAMPPGTCCAIAGGGVLRTSGALSVGQVTVGDVLARERARRDARGKLAEAQRRCREIQDRQRAEAERIAALEAEAEKLAQQAAALREQSSRFERETLGKSRTQIAVVEETLRIQRADLQREVVLAQQVQAERDGLHQQADKLKAERAGIIARVRKLRPDSPGSDAPSETVEPDEDWVEDDRVQTDLPVRLHEIQQRCHRIEEQQRARVGQIATREVRLEELTQQAAQAREEAAHIERETVGTARTEVAVAEEALRSQRSALQREVALLDRLQAQMSARRQRAEELKAEHAAVLAHTGELRKAFSQVEAQLHQVRARIQPAEEELARIRDEQGKIEVRERRARTRLRDMEARQGRAHLEVARRQDELKLLARRIEEDLGLVELELAESVTAQTPLPLRPLVSQLPVVEELPEGLEEEIQRLKARLRRLGSVNPNAPEDYAEVQERYHFLSEQTTDLEKASAQLHQVVAELDELMESAFHKIFDAVAAQFSDTFTDLFNGGSARLELTEPDDLMNTGVDIVARPPGKRAQRLALLSGGERSLTAVALLFSLLRVSPTPFCVLDEVDAMLDEANVGRFRALLRELAQKTQFIVITHNRVTTEAANTIYGVSMGADGVSQVVSLELE